MIVLMIVPSGYKYKPKKWLDFIDDVLQEQHAQRKYVMRHKQWHTDIISNPVSDCQLRRFQRRLGLLELVLGVRKPLLRVRKFCVHRLLIAIRRLAHRVRRPGRCNGTVVAVLGFVVGSVHLHDHFVGE